MEQENRKQANEWVSLGLVQGIDDWANQYRDLFVKVVSGRMFYAIKENGNLYIATGLQNNRGGITKYCVCTEGSSRITFMFAPIN